MFGDLLGLISLRSRSAAPSTSSASNESMRPFPAESASPLIADKMESS